MDRLIKSLTVVSLLFVSLVNVLAQQQYPSCDEVVPICSLDDLDGFSETMFTLDTGNGPDPLCPNSIYNPNNISWFSFIAGSTSFEIQLTLSNCTTAGFFTGIQFGVYSDCDFNESLFCQGPCTTGDANGEVVFTINDLNIGDDYFIFLDGCNGSICDYEVAILSGGQFAALPEIGDIDCETLPCDEICVGAEDILFSPLNLDGSAYDLSITYEWTITPPLPGFTSPQLVDDGDLQLELDFPTAGTYNLCVFADNGCDLTDVTCTQLTVTEIQDEVFEEMFVCTNEFPTDVLPANQDPNLDGGFAYGDTDWTGPQITEPGLLTVTTVNAYGCSWEQSVNTTEYEVPETVMIDTFFCAGPANGVLIGGDYINEYEEDYEILIPNYQGCDSNIIVNAYPIEFNLELEIGPCNPDGSISILIQDIEVDVEEFLDFGGTLTWEWTKNTVVIANTTNLTSYPVPTGEDGSYSVLVTATVDGVSCDNMVFLVSDAVFVDFDNIQPNLSLITDPNNICPETQDSVVFELDIFNYAVDPAEYTIVWTVPSDAPIVSGGVDQPFIGLDMTTTTSSQVCYSVSNLCGNIMDCLDVTFAPSDEPEIMLQGQACPNGTFTVEALGLPPVVDIDTIIWDLDGGDLITGDTSFVTTGPLEIDWSGDTDQKIVTVTVSYSDACNSYSAMDTLNFIIDPAPPNVSCFSNQESITFEWDPVPDATSYIVTDGGNTTTTTMTTYFIDGLLEDVCRDITVEAITASGSVIYCQQLIGASAFGSCCTKACPSTTIDLNNPYPSTICLGLNETNEAFTITPSAPLGVGVGVFSGPGITDATLGTFDPSVAGVGTHTIQYYFEFQDVTIAGCRTPTAFEQVTVTQLPTFTMTASESTVCVQDEVTISFDGTYDVASSTNLTSSGATIINDSDPQNIILSWNTAGSVTLTAFVTADGCGDVLADDIQMTVEDLPPLNLMCSDMTSSSVTFTWDMDIDYVDYTVTIDSDPPYNTTDNVVTVSNLDELTPVSIQVTGNSNNSCPPVEESISCTSEQCPNVALIPNYTGTEVICLDGNETPLAITGTPDDATLLFNPQPVFITANGMTLTNGMFDPTAMGEGTYDIQLLLVDDNCMYPAAFEITVESVPALAVDASTKICIDQTWDISYTGDVSSDYTYAWSLDNGETFSGSVDQQVDFDTPGTYLLSVNAETDNCQANEITAMIEVIDSLTTPILSCQESVSGILFSWIDGNDECEQSYSIDINGTVVDNITDIEYLAEGFMPDTEVIITVINESTDCVCTEKKNSFTCRTLPCPPISIQLPYQTNTICRELGVTSLPDEEFLVTSNDDISAYTITYVSSVPLNGNALDVNVIPAGTYAVTAIATNGFCSTQTAAVLTIVDVPEPAFDHESVICIEDDLTITYTGSDLTDATFEWTTDTGSPSFANDLNPTITYDTPGDYVYTFEGVLNGECNFDEEVMVTVLDSLRTPTIDCESTLDEITLTIGAIETDCDGDLTLLIGGVPYQGDISSGVVTLEDLQAETDYEITVMNTSACGCSDKIKTINCSTADCPDWEFVPTFDAGLDFINFSWTIVEPDCPGQLSIDIDNQPYTGDLSTGFIELSELTSEQHVTFDVTYTSDCGCVYTETVSWITDPCPEVNLQLSSLADQYCLVSGSTIMGQLEASVDGVTLGVSDVVWIGQGVNADGLINLDADLISAGDQVYMITYELADCQYDDSISIQFIAEPTFDITIDKPCPGETMATLDVINYTESQDIVYTLNGSEITAFSSISIGDGQHVVEATAFGECMYSQYEVFDVQPFVDLEITGDTISFAGEENSYDYNSNYTFDQVIWEFNGETLVDAPSSLAFNTSSTLCLTGIIDDCPTTVCQQLSIIEEVIFVPNIFNPNESAPNNTLQVFSNADIENLMSFSVFDRWGNQVFNAENVSPTDVNGQWNGTFNGEQLEQGVYVYVIEVLFTSGEVRQVIGDITLVR